MNRLRLVRDIRPGYPGLSLVQLASALWWQAAVGATLLVATYDRELWHEAKGHGLPIFPERHP